MKLRKHITFILIILIFLISGLYSIGVMVKEHNTNLKAYETRIHECEMSGNNDSYCEEVLNSKKVIDSAKKYLLKYDRVYKNYKACSLFNESCDIYEDIDKVNKIYRKVKR